MKRRFLPGWWQDRLQWLERPHLCDGFGQQPKEAVDPDDQPVSKIPGLVSRWQTSALYGRKRTVLGPH